MTSRERVEKTLNHQEPERVPFDLGSSPWTGIHARAVEGLRDYYGLEKRPVKVWEPYQFLGEVDEDLAEVIGVDTARLSAPVTAFGFRNERWKEFRTWWGQEVLLPGDFETSPAPGGGLYIYPEGDRSAPPRGHMPEGGFFFDTIIYQEKPFELETWQVEDNFEEFTPLSEADLAYYAAEAKRLADTERAVLAGFPGTSFGDIFAVPAPWMKRPRGLRDIAEWYMATISRPEAIHKIFSYQLEVTLANLEKIKSLLAEVVTVALVCGADFGTQTSQFCSRRTLESLYAPYYRRLNCWIHENTSWKTMKHSCGAIEGFIDLFLDCGFDILNPVQISAQGMDPKTLKRKYGDRIVFWGGGINTQKTLPFGTPAEVRAEVLELCRIFAPGGGFVFNPVHNVQANVPVENIAAMISALHEFNRG